MKAQPAKGRHRKRNADEAQLVGLAILRLRRDTGMTLRQLAAQVGCTSTALARYEQGIRQPCARTLGRIVAAMGLTLTDLYRAQQRPAGQEGPPEDGTLPPDTREPDTLPLDTRALDIRTPPARSHKDILRLAQECGKAVAHCCLAFMDLQTGSWRAPWIGASAAASAAAPALEAE